MSLSMWEYVNEFVCECFIVDTFQTEQRICSTQYTPVILWDIYGFSKIRMFNKHPFSTCCWWLLTDLIHENTFFFTMGCEGRRPSHIDKMQHISTTHRCFIVVHFRFIRLTFIQYMSDDIHVCADIYACRMSGWWWCGSQANDHCSRYCSNIFKCESAGCLQRQKPKHATFFQVTIVPYTNLVNHNHRLILQHFKIWSGWM